MSTMQTEKEFTAANKVERDATVAAKKISVVAGVAAAKVYAERSFKSKLFRPRHLVCRSAALLVGTMAGIILTMIFDSRPCVDIVGGSVTPAEQHIGLPIRVTWHMKPINYCDGEVTDFFRHEQTGYVSTSETRKTGYSQVWNGKKDVILPFYLVKIVPDGLEGAVYYEPKIQRWNNVLQKIFNPINVTGVSVRFERLPKLPPKESMNKLRQNTSANTQ